jgi:hypothetical protein
MPGTAALASTEKRSERLCPQVGHAAVVVEPSVATNNGIALKLYQRMIH